MIIHPVNKSTISERASMGLPNSSSSICDLSVQFGDVVLMLYMCIHVSTSLFLREVMEVSHISRQISVSVMSHDPSASQLQVAQEELLTRQPCAERSQPSEAATNVCLPKFHVFFLALISSRNMQFLRGPKDMAFSEHDSWIISP